MKTTRPAGPLVRLAVKQEADAFDARLQAIVAAAKQELDLPEDASLNVGTMSWEYDAALATDETDEPS